MPAALAALGAYRVSEPYGPDSEAADYDRVAKGLFVGSAPYPQWVRTSDFGVVVLCAKEWQPKSSFGDVKVIRCPLDDDRLTPRIAERVVDAALDVSEAMASGSKILVTCWQGKNRSGLVAATAIVMFTGARTNGRAAMAQVRRGRRGAIGNPWYDHFLKSVLPRAVEWWDEAERRGLSQSATPMFPPGLDWGEGLHW